MCRLNRPVHCHVYVWEGKLLLLWLFNKTPKQYLGTAPKYHAYKEAYLEISFHIPAWASVKTPSARDVFSPI